MEMSKFRLAVSIAILTVAVLTVWFLVQDIYRLQRLYKLVTASHSVLWPTLKPSEIQAMIATRQTAIALTIITATVTILATAFVPSLKRNNPSPHGEIR